MFSQDEILDLLRNGQSADEIAALMAENLNVAQAKYAQLQKEEQMRAEAAAKREENMNNDLTTILDLLKDFCVTYYAETEKEKTEWAEAFAEITADDFMKTLTNVKNIHQGYHKAEDKVKEVVSKAKNVDDILVAWLKELGL
jgi:predicted nucleotidyltransferase